MKFEEHRSIVVLISLIFSVLVGVICWYLLEKINVVSSVEIATLLSLGLINTVFIYFLHGKGLLPPPVRKEVERGFAVGGFRIVAYARKKYNFFQPKIKLFNKNYRRKKYLTHLTLKLSVGRKYNRKKFRNHL